MALPVRHWTTEKGEYMPSVLNDLISYFQLNLSGKSFFDLGSGYGEIVELASLFGATSSGMEFDQDMVNHTRVPELVEQGDFMGKNLSAFDFLFYFINGTDNEDSLKTKLNAECNGKLILYVKDVPQSMIDTFTSGLTCTFDIISS